jgi:hypothetical protein
VRVRAGAVTAGQEPFTGADTATLWASSTPLAICPVATTHFPVVTAAAVAVDCFKYVVAATVRTILVWLVALDEVDPGRAIAVTLIVTVEALTAVTVPRSPNEPRPAPPKPPEGACPVPDPVGEPEGGVPLGAPADPWAAEPDPPGGVAPPTAPRWLAHELAAAIVTVAAVVEVLADVPLVESLGVTLTQSPTVTAARLADAVDVTLVVDAKATLVLLELVVRVAPAEPTLATLPDDTEKAAAWVAGAVEPDVALDDEDEADDAAVEDPDDPQAETAAARPAAPIAARVRRLTDEGNT